ncbi:hypothetical protein M378DRAFT_1018931 [Amanita muscaria Koide BX008]|uniref:Uncharacterized protein n=1 Tax=Amanita muscaria (strain Koide BX008) TaxID=946122 RepID=A0A0C2TUZ0_AMAMK|nr:hypothetical protein M378DRAFT_1018931 [Amanita muscaria Koide BX008]
MPKFSELVCLFLFVLFKLSERKSSHLRQLHPTLIGSIEAAFNSRFGKAADQAFLTAVKGAMVVRYMCGLPKSVQATSDLDKLQAEHAYHHSFNGYPSFYLTSLYPYT